MKAGAYMEKYVWNALLWVMFLVALWFTGNFLYQLYDYYSLGAEQNATKTEWSVKEISDERYLMEANYTFDIDGKSYAGHTLLDSPSYRNKWAAEEMIPEYTSKPWTVWYSAKDPQHSSLQKDLPVKVTVSMLLLWAVLCYFIWLRFSYITRFGKL